jgi:transcriptional regulator with XRE-family HTH domain
MYRQQEKRPITRPTLGSRLETLRGPTTSRAVVCAKLAQLGLRLDRSTLLQYERGTVESPSAVVLWGLAQIYRVPLDDLMSALLFDVTKRPQAKRHEAEPLTPEQRIIAELSGPLSPHLRQTLVAFLEALRRDLSTAR